MNKINGFKNKKELNLESQCNETKAKGMNESLPQT